MEKTMTLAEAKKFFGNDAVYETETGFLVNEFGKYEPNMTFVVGKRFFLDGQGQPISPIESEADREVTDNMNLAISGDVRFTFGDFWRSKKGGACFRPKDPMVAKHLLLTIDWGGAFNTTRGLEDDPKDIGALYYRRARSNGGGYGHDYLVVPVGYVRKLYDPEFDGEVSEGTEPNFEANAKPIRAKYSKLYKARRAEADKALREKLAAEEQSRQNREKFLPRLKEINAEIQRCAEMIGQSFSKMELDDTYVSYRFRKYLYSPETLEMFEGEREWARRTASDELAKEH